MSDQNTQQADPDLPVIWAVYLFHPPEAGAKEEHLFALLPYDDNGDGDYTVVSPGSGIGGASAEYLKVSRPAVENEFRQLHNDIAWKWSRRSYEPDRVQVLAMNDVLSCKDIQSLIESGEWEMEEIKEVLAEHASGADKDPDEHEERVPALT